jgi:uncharacterized protein YacL
MIIQNVSNFYKTSDYMPIITAALLVDMIILVRIVSGSIKIRSLNKWYIKFGIFAVLADVLSIVIGVIIARFLYTLLFKNYVLIYFLILACVVQLIHDTLFARFFNSVPKGKNAMLDVFKEYAKEVGFKILGVDALMVVFTILIGGVFASLNPNWVVVILIMALYILPYLLFSIKL